MRYRFKYYDRLPVITRKSETIPLVAQWAEQTCNAAGVTIFSVGRVTDEESLFTHRWRSKMGAWFTTIGTNVRVSHVVTS